MVPDDADSYSESIEHTERFGLHSLSESLSAGSSKHFLFYLFKSCPFKCVCFPLLKQNIMWCHMMSHFKWVLWAFIPHFLTIIPQTNRLPLSPGSTLSIQQPSQRAAWFPFIEIQYNPSHDTVRNFLNGCLQTIREKKGRAFFLSFSPHKRNSKAFPNLVDCPSRKRNYSSYQAARTTRAIKWLIKPHCCYHWNHSETMLSCRGVRRQHISLFAACCSELQADVITPFCSQKHDNLPHFVALKLYIDYLVKCTWSPFKFLKDYCGCNLSSCCHIMISVESHQSLWPN